MRNTDQFTSCVLFWCFCFCCENSEFLYELLWNVMRSFSWNRSKFSCLKSVNVDSKYRQRLTVGRSQISSNISQIKTLCVNHCSKILDAKLHAWFTNQHLASFDQTCPRLMILFYDLLVDFNSFPRILFSSSSKTGDQLFLAAFSVSIISFLTKFISTFFLEIVFFWWGTQIHVLV